MYDINQICILGTDKRMDYVAQFLYDKGIEVSRDAKDVSIAKAVVCEPSYKGDFAKLLSCMCKNCILFVGKTDLLFDKLCEKWQIKAYNYLNNKTVISKNAYLTAKGIVREAKEKNVVFEESHCLVCGYGYCGTEIAKELKKQKADVDIFVRRRDLKDKIEKEGYGYISMNRYENNNFEKYSYIFNTVPACILTEVILSKLSKSVVIFDIASLPGGVDDDYCKKHHIEVYHSLGIPGRMYPQEAGNLIANEIYDVLYDVSTVASE